MNITDFSDFKLIAESLGDHIFWKPLELSEIEEVSKYIDKLNESKSWNRGRNQEKGALLEDFAVYVFARFQGVEVEKNRRPTDNETDVEVTLSEIFAPEFMRQYLSPKIICEYKNKATSSVDIGMVAKLAELLPSRGSKIGIFFSINGISRNGWRYGEGKRKKILLKTGIPIISFRIDELRQLLDGRNFYTMIKEKIKNLYDEIDDDSPDAPSTGHIEYKKRMLEIKIILHFVKCKIIDDTDAEKLRKK
ncbi:hypothetical protein [Paenibacillus sp. ALJ109b]|uniref:hypothetical protein n=1 Tax=Paenibacillus sp. ALJ109b TaxID=2709068 RepID=UPI0013D1359B|nr:hypothetical protein [Paenibacillus sp. ALJ109b]NEU63564.1 hypothetical protein [Paenibacillus sp. ALJ109b]